MDYEISADEISSGRMGTQASSSDAVTYHCSQWLMVGKMNVAQISGPSSRLSGAAVTAIIKKMLWVAANTVPKQKLFRKSWFLRCLLAGIGIREPENNNKTPRGLKQRKLKDFPEHQNSIIYNPLRKLVSGSTHGMACLHFRDSTQWLTSHQHFPKAKPILDDSVTLVRLIMGWGHTPQLPGLLLVFLWGGGEQGKEGEGRPGVAAPAALDLGMRWRRSHPLTTHSAETLSP